jgi:predicted RNA-binding protein YlqC (UPF0109 family)
MSSTKELLEVMARSLVDSPEVVSVNELKGEQTTILELKVAQEDMGKIIGKQGRIANAIRTIIKAASLHKGSRIVVEIIEA